MRGRVGLAIAIVMTVVLATTSTAFAAPNDPLYASQYGPEHINAPTAWARTRGGNVTIAVVDSGVDLQHEDLAGKLVPGRDFVDDDDTPDDENGHGTHVAGTAAAATENGRGIAGIAPDAKIMPIRVLDELGRGSSADVIAGIRFAVERGAKVVNLSLGSEITLIDVLGGGSVLEEVIAFAYARGALVVAAAGNSVAAGNTQPSGYNRNVQAVVVTATDRNRRQPFFANRADTQWSVAAPGAGILSTIPPETDMEGRRYGELSGTSMAAPHVAGVAALLFAQGLTNRQVVDRLLLTARPVPGSGAGAGLVDAAAAVSTGPAVVAPGPTAVPARPTPTPAPAPAPSTAPAPAPSAAPARSAAPAPAPSSSGRARATTTTARPAAGAASRPTTPLPASAPTTVAPATAAPSEAAPPSAPAPSVTVAGAPEAPGEVAAPAPDAAPVTTGGAPATSPAGATSDDDGGGGNGLVIALLALLVAGVAGGIFATISRRR